MNLKNRLLSVLGWMLFAFGGVTVSYRLAGWGFHDSLNLFWAGALMLYGALIQYITLRWPRNTYSLWFTSLYMLILLSIMLTWEVAARGYAQLYALFLFPMLVYYLQGLWRGLLSCLLLGIVLILQLPLHEWDATIYGTQGMMVLGFYGLFVGVGALCSFAQDSYMQKMSDVAQTDLVTGLPNRSGFVLRLEAAVMRGQTFHLLMMDLDHFRRINLVLGIKKADELLKVIAQKMLGDSSIMDLARHYGDSFVWIYEGTAEQMQTSCEDVQNLLGQITEDQHIPVPLSASFGVSRFPQDGDTPQNLWSMAELALKKAKNGGRSQLRYFLSSDADHETRQGVLFSALEKAIATHSIQVYFQPKVNLEAGSITGMEALVRWTDPVLGEIPPMEFIPIAEQGGLISALSDIVNEKSIAFLGALRKKGYLDISLSINISPAQMLQGDLCVKLIGLCLANQVPNRQIFLEVTEGILVQPDVASAILDLHENGFRLSLDDFGTGYSSLSYLHRFRFDELKVDKGFTDGLTRSEKERRIFETIVQLSHDLGLHTVVEGVEKHGQIAMLQPLGTVQVQGWFFAQAMPPDLFEVYLDNFNFVEALENGAR